MRSNRSSRQEIRRTRQSLTLTAGALAACFCLDGLAQLPTNPSGSGFVATQVGGALTVTTSAARTNIGWDTFSIGKGNRVDFVQPSAASWVMNRVLTPTPSELLGTLSSNGGVYLYNPAGIFVRPGALIDVASFVASTLPITDSDFFSGRKRFTALPGAGGISNEGTIRAASGGSVYLVAPSVENHGVISAPNGEILLAAGKSVELVDTGTPGVRIELTADGEQALNVGQLLAESGRIGLAGALVRNSGLINAGSAVSEGGRIFLKATNKIEVDAAGRILANGSSGGSVQLSAGDTTLVAGRIEAIGSAGQGGRIEILGDKAGVIDAAVVDASGKTGGGTILVGGDYQGINPDLINATLTYFGPQATLKADATDNGDGGKVIVWANDTTRAYGNISAKGGPNGGNGGFVETSGHRYLDVAGIQVSASATTGAAGTWLLDPNDINIIHAASGDSQITAAPNFSPNQFDSSASTLSDGSINSALAGGTNVTVQTSNAYGSGVGDIIFTSDAIAITRIGTANLSLTANHDIVLRGSIQNLNAANMTLTLTPGAAGTVLTPSGATATLDGASTGLLDVLLPSGKSWLNSGTVNLNGNTRTLITGATFTNASGGVLNLATNQYAFVDSSYTGVINNSGALNVNLDTAWEGTFNNTSTGAVNIAAGKVLSVQDANVINGTLNIGSGGTLWFSEMHAGAGNVSGATFNGPGVILVGSGSTNVPMTFTNVTLNNVGVRVEPAPGASSISFGGTLAMNNAWLFESNSYALPTSMTLSGSNAFISTGALTLGAGTYAYSSPGDLSFIASGNINGTSLSLTNSSAGGIRFLAGWTGTAFASLPATPTNYALYGAPNAGVGTISLIGSSIQTAGQISLKSGGSISQAAGSIIRASRLDASTGTGALSLQGNNDVATIALASGSGNIFYRSNAPMVHVESATTGGSVSIASNAGSGGAIGLGTISGGSGVTVAADGQILDDNGVGVTNVTSSGSVSLSSAYGGTAGGLAISADTDAPTVSAVVAATAGSGGIRIRNTNAALTTPTVTLIDNSATLASKTVLYSSAGNLTTTNLNVGGANQVAIASDLALTINSSLSATGDVLLTAGTALATNSGSSVSAGGTALATAPSVTVKGAISGTAGVGVLGSTVDILGGTLSSSAGAVAVGADVLTMIGGNVSGQAGVALLGASKIGLDSGASVVAGAGDVAMISGGDIDILNGSTVSASTGNVAVSAGGNIKLGDLLGGSGTISAGDDVLLELTGADSTLNLWNGSKVLADLFTGVAATIYIDFPARSSGGIFINGVETTTTSTGGPGFYVVNSSTPAVEGAGLSILYGGGSGVTAVGSLVGQAVDSATGSGGSVTEVSATDLLTTADTLNQEEEQSSTSSDTALTPTEGGNDATNKQKPGQCT